MDFLIVFAQIHKDFRLAELDSIAILNGFEYAFVNSEHSNPESPFMIIRLQSEEHAKLLAERSVLIKSIHEYYCCGATWDSLHDSNRKSAPKWIKYAASTSFKFIVQGYNHSITKAEQKSVIESFSYMDFDGEVNMKTPDIVLTIWVEYESYPPPKHLKHTYFGRFLYDSSTRPLIHTFDVKKRTYYGNTSMESEMSILMANQTLASPGKIMYDPFAGTGSLIYPSAYFGATFFGSDIDPRQMIGKDTSSVGIHRALKQYKLPEKSLIDLATFDVTWSPWRCGDLFHAIVCDPPYGVRAGAKTLGRKRELSKEAQEAYWEHRNRPHPLPYIPPTKPYELSTLVRDLVLLARWLLKVEGRLVFFLPTVNDDYQEIDIQDMLCEGMEVVANSLQDFGNWGRRLVTIRKLPLPPTCKEWERPVLSTSKPTEENVHVPGHKDFREKYFKGFK